MKNDFSGDSDGHTIVKNLSERRGLSSGAPFCKVLGCGDSATGPKFLDRLVVGILTSLLSPSTDIGLIRSGLSQNGISDETSPSVILEKFSE